MEKSSILSADILDILFEGRNKSYGAYDLRKTYNRRIVRSLAGMFGVCLLFFVGSILANDKKKTNNDIVIGEVELKSIKEEEKKIEPPKEIPKEEPKLETAKVTPPKIVPDEEVKPEDEVKDMEKLETAKIGTTDIKGAADDGSVVAPPVESKGIDVGPPKTKEDIDEIYVIVARQAEFPGGQSEWIKFLKRQLNTDVPSDNGAPAADYTVTVSFIVDREGNISDVKAENDPGYGTAAEAVRVIRKGPKWQPAEQNGHKVMYRQRQNITFRVAEN